MFALASEGISEESARRELWISFGSLVRSYIAAAQIGMEPLLVMVSQADAGNLELVSRERSIQLTFDAGKAEGYWVVHGACSATDNSLLAEGAFRIGIDSLMEWTGLPGRQEMNAVAEALSVSILN